MLADHTIPGERTLQCPPSPSPPPPPEGTPPPTHRAGCPSRPTYARYWGHEALHDYRLVPLPFSACDADGWNSRPTNVNSPHSILTCVAGPGGRTRLGPGLGCVGQGLISVESQPSPGSRVHHSGVPEKSGTGLASASSSVSATPFALMSAISHSISLISRRWASTIWSAS